MELELLEMKLAQKSVAVAQERENNKCHYSMSTVDHSYSGII